MIRGKEFREAFVNPPELGTRSCEETALNHFSHVKCADRERSCAYGLGASGEIADSRCAHSAGVNLVRINGGSPTKEGYARDAPGDGDHLIHIHPTCNRAPAGVWRFAQECLAAALIERGEVIRKRRARGNRA